MTAAKAAASEKKTAPKAAPAKKPAVKKAAPAKKAVSSTAAKKPVVAKVKRGEPVAHGVGRRKAAVARVWLRRGGTGVLTINNCAVSEYFDTEVARRLAQIPLTIVPTIAARYDYDANVFGGGIHGQADAIKLAISRALVEADETSRVALKEQGFLTVDARIVERKKFGQKKARRKFQFVKR
jgi:small subunit ribosomal protein S9